MFWAILRGGPFRFDPLPTGELVPADALGQPRRMVLLRFTASVLLLALLGIGSAAATEIALHHYVLSDALGGFRLLAASGIGSRVDPVVVEEEITDAAPAVLTIRRLRSDRSPAGTPLELNIVKRVRNASKRIWGGFEVELQEVLREPSDYGDGLSFNQYALGPDDADADRFGETRRLYEPFDRIRFEDGYVDPDGTLTIRLTITDPTPSAVFYLVQDPQLLSARLPLPRKSVAAR
jgi:hypothetical protein